MMIIFCTIYDSQGRSCGLISRDLLSRNLCPNQMGFFFLELYIQIWILFLWWGAEGRYLKACQQSFSRKKDGWIWMNGRWCTSHWVWCTCCDKLTQILTSPMIATQCILANNHPLQLSYAENYLSTQPIKPWSVWVHSSRGAAGVMVWRRLSWHTLTSLVPSERCPHVTTE